MANDIITPFKQRMTAAGNAPQIKVYPGVGHFIHTDVPYEFAKDTVDFLKTRPRRCDVDRRDRCADQRHRTGCSGGAAAAQSGKPSGLAK